MDLIGNALTVIKNALVTGKSEITVFSNSIVKNICEIMKQEGFIKNYEVSHTVKNIIKVELKYLDLKRKKPALTSIRMISKPSRKIYVKSESIKPVMSGFGIGIISTNQGVMTNYQAKKKKLGGELICELF